MELKVSNIFLLLRNTRIVWEHSSALSVTLTSVLLVVTVMLLLA